MYEKKPIQSSEESLNWISYNLKQLVAQVTTELKNLTEAIREIRDILDKQGF